MGMVVRPKPIAALILSLAALAAVVLVLEAEDRTVLESVGAVQPVGAKELPDVEDELLLQEDDLFEEDDDEELIQAAANTNGRILHVTPQAGPYHGGNVVEIGGKALSSGAVGDIASVKVAGIPVAQVLSNEKDKIVVRLASRHEAEGAVQVGRGPVQVDSRTMGLATLEEAYEYKPAPLILGMSPDNGPHLGKTPVIIRGRNLCGADAEKSLSVKICEQDMCGPKTTKCVCRGDHITTSTPAYTNGNQGGACTLRVTSDVFGEAVAHRAFTYSAAPAITKVTPTAGAISGGNKITISGYSLSSGKGHLGEDVQVTVGGQKATVYAYTPDAIKVSVPRNIKQAGFVDITVSSTRHGKASASGMYRLLDKPTISHMSATKGRASGNEPLTIYCHNMGLDIREVTIGDHRVKILQTQPNGGHRTDVQIVTPVFGPAEQGVTHKVTVTSASHGRAEFNGFTVSGSSTVAAVLPSAGPSAGGTMVTILGTGLATSLADVMAVRLADQPATVISANPRQIVARTREGAAATEGGVEIESRSAGVVKSNMPSAQFKYRQNGQVLKVNPAQGAFVGGDTLVVEGTNLCRRDCMDLMHVMVGDAKVTDFVVKTPSRLVLHTPPGMKAGGRGVKDISVVSSESGEAVALAAFEYLGQHVSGRVEPHNVPLRGNQVVTITGDDLGSGEAYNVLLAGVAAKVLSASRNKIVAQVGDGSAFARQNALQAEHGLDGTIVIEVKNHGIFTGMDSRIGFHYNAECSIDDVKVALGPKDGEATLTLRGSHMGMGDELVTVNGVTKAEAGLTKREYQGSNIKLLHVRMPTAALGGKLKPKRIEITSHRTGRCVWPHPARKPQALVVGKPAKFMASPNVKSDAQRRFVRKEVDAFKDDVLRVVKDTKELAYTPA